jgi:hypothetical protein
VVLLLIFGFRRLPFSGITLFPSLPQILLDLIEIHPELFYIFQVLVDELAEARDGLLNLPGLRVLIDQEILIIIAWLILDIVLPFVDLCELRAVSSVRTAHKLLMR